MSCCRLAAVALVLFVTACGDAGADPETSADASDTDTGLGDVGLDAAPDATFDSGGADAIADTDPDVADATDATDAATDAADAADAMDATDATDADTDVTDPSDCPCDLTVVCEEGCACDIACNIEVGPSPLGAESVGRERNEIVVFETTDGDARLDRALLYDDGFEADHPAMHTADVALDRGWSDLSFAADLDEDGREEAIVVTATGVHVFDWDGAAFTGRTVYTWPTADRFDAAAGDLDHDGGRVLVVTRQVGATLTVDALDVGEDGDAMLRASVDVPDVVRHAVAIAPLVPGEPPHVHLVVTRTSREYREPAERIELRLDGDAFAETRRVTMEPFCGTGYDGHTTDDGFSLEVGDLDNRPGVEFFVAAYCPTVSDDPNLVVAVHAGDGDRTHVGYPGTPYGVHVGVTRSGSVRPHTAIGRFRNPSGEPGETRAWSVAVGWTRDDLSARVALFDTEFAHTGRLEGGGREVGVGVLTGLAVRDLDADARDAFVAVVTGAENRCTDFVPCLWYGGSRVYSSDADVRDAWPYIHVDPGPAVRTETFGGALVAVGDFDQDSMRIRATGEVYRHLSGPQINNVVAAPPTWHREGVTHAGGSETTFEVSASEGTSHGGIATWGLSISAGIGVSLYKLVELYGYVTVSVGVTHSWTFTSTVTFSRAISAGDAADLVSYSRVVYASHEYEMVAHPDAELIGELIRIDVPGPNYESTTSVPQFREAFPEADLLLPPTLLAHTVGQPDTYDIGGACTFAALQERIGTGVVSAVYQSTELTDVGNAPSGSRSLSVDIETQYATGHDVVLEVGGVVGGALVVGGSITGYVGGGYSYQRTLSRSGTYTGSVGVISEGYGPDTRYQWGLCLFQWSDAADPQYASYPVTTYVVTPY